MWGGDSRAADRRSLHYLGGTEPLPQPSLLWDLRKSTTLCSAPEMWGLLVIAAALLTLTNTEKGAIKYCLFNKYFFSGKW